jgi:hypothetical protein
MAEQPLWELLRDQAMQGLKNWKPAPQGPTDEELVAFFEQHDWNYISPETFCEIARAVLDTFGNHTQEGD